MKVRAGVWIVVAVVLSQLLLTGMIQSGQYKAVASAEAIGFDALAHEIFSPGVR